MVSATQQSSKRPQPTAGSGPFIFSHLDVTGGETSATKRCATLPAFECDVCGERAIEIELTFPSLKVPKTIPAKLLKGGITTVSLEQWTELIAELGKANPGFASFVPGMGIDPVVLRTSGKLRDVLIDGIELFFSRRVVQRVKDAGVSVRASPVQVFKRGARVDDYYVLEPVVAPVTAKSWMEKCYARCQRCGQWKLKIKFKDYLVLDKAREFDKKRWPSGEAVVYTPDRLFVLYSEEFVAACQGADLEGLAFERAGTWV